MNIYISASELAVLSGHNTYKNKSEFLVKYWKKYFSKDFLRIQHLIQKQNKLVVLPETAHQTVARIAKANNVDQKIMNTLYSSSKNKNAKSMVSQKESAINAIIKNVPKNQQDLLKKSANSVVYTNFGTRNEYNGVDLFSEEYNVQVRRPTNYFSEDLFIIECGKDTHIWSIGGKIDGIYTDNDGSETILEIKNRMKGLFNKLRDYEKVQCFAYMFALNKQKVDLAECYKKKDSIEMNVIDILWDDEFWNNQIISNLSTFVDDFYDFLEDDERKIQLITE
jgi:hypothetical protein